MRFVVGVWFEEPKLLALTAVLMAVSSGCEIAVPWIAGRFIDGLAGDGPIGLLWIALLISYLMANVIRNVAFRVFQPFSARNMKRVIDGGYRAVQSYPSAWHTERHSGETARSIMKGANGYDVVSDALVTVLWPAAITLTGIVFVVSCRWPWLGVASIIFTGLFLGSHFLLMIRYAGPSHQRSADLDGKIAARLSDVLACDILVKTSSSETRELRGLSLITAQWSAAVCDTWARFTNIRIIYTLILTGLLGVLTGILLAFRGQGMVSPGDMTFVFTAFLTVSAYLRNVCDNIRVLQRGIADVVEVASFFHNQETSSEVQEWPLLAVSDGTIVFDKVSLQYPGDGQPAIQALSAVIEGGKTTAIVGPTGAGKSSLIRMLLGLQLPTSGSLLIDGQDISEVATTSLRRSIALVHQDPMLLRRSIYENIAYSSETEEKSDIVDAARLACIDDRVQDLTFGYNTIVGERGVKLSGGERQRIAIARAILQNAPILILDEATSSLDNSTERDIQSALGRLRQGRTCIMIAHRLSTIRDADQILVMDSGKIVEAGSHDDLRSSGGLYSRLIARFEPAPPNGPFISEIRD